jgi:uncharacterized protein YlzI (FlbEa/FlbD family)
LCSTRTFIEHIDATPDTVITLTNGQILRVLATAEEVIGRLLTARLNDRSSG